MEKKGSDRRIKDVQLVRYPAREPVFYFLNFGVFEKDPA